MLKKTLSLFLSVCFMLTLQMHAFADAALPPGYIGQRNTDSWVIVVVIVAVVVIAAVILFRVLSKRKK